VSDGTLYQGQADPGSAASEFNALDFVVRMAQARMNVATLVKVVAVTNAPGQLAAVGQVDVLPLVNRLDGQGKATPHAVVHGLVYFRYQGGSNAVLIDPQVGDVGWAVFADRDISAVKSTAGAQSNPGSLRKFNMADGCFFGVPIGPAPRQYVQFTGQGITIADMNGNTIVMNSLGVTINGALINQAGDVITKAGHNLDTHLHTGVTTGSGNTGPPV
jgi:hypothetical protein